MTLIVQKKVSDAAPAVVNIEVANGAKTGNPTVLVKGRGDLVEAFINMLKKDLKGKFSSMASDKRGGYLLMFKGISLDDLNKKAQDAKDRVESSMGDSVIVKKKGSVNDDGGEDMMSYVCPKCGYEEDFEPETEPHICPKCGATMVPEAEMETDSDRTYSEAVGPYKKGSLVAKKKKKEPITQVGDAAKKYGDLMPGEASVMFAIYEDGGFTKSDLKMGESLKKKGYITFSANMGNTPEYTGKLTKKGEQWVKDYEDGKFDSTTAEWTEIPKGQVVSWQGENWMILDAVKVNKQ